MVRDVSKQHALEEQLRHARQMEALGRLSAGVAHEFNNLLTIINGYSAIMQDRGDAHSETQLAEIQKAANRGAIFTRQLLDFGSKRQPTELVFDVREVATGLETMLRPLLGASITVETHQSETPLLVEADAARIEQLLVNLAVNSRDAMTDGGTLRIATSSRELTQPDCATLPGLLPGQHVVVQVSDTGSGMDSATAERAFEPFFTTKTNSGGTGLGLAMVYNAVKQSRGHVAFKTAPGEGTTFTMHFPLTDKPIAPVTASEPAPVQKRQPTERILLVEDDASVRILVKDLLNKAGYTVLEARNGAEALQLGERESRHIDLMLTDYLMPGIRGDDLAQRILAIRPTMRVLYMSGCVSPDGIGEDPRLLGSVLHKPFSPTELLQRLRAELDHG